jgi:hypothetical protein
MKISVGVEVLVCILSGFLCLTDNLPAQETQDLAELARYFRESDPSSRAENPVDVVVKNPFIAMRYPKSISTVRFTVLSKLRTYSSYLRRLGPG